MSFPEELKHLRPIATRADELEQIEPAIAYWSRYYIVQKAVAQKVRSAAVDGYLSSLLDGLESMRKKHKGLTEIEDDAAGKSKVTSFALKVFDNANREEKAARATQSTAAKFLAAAGFLELCSCFGAVEKELADKRKYAKVQAMRIQSAFAAGKDPNQKRRDALPVEAAAPTTMRDLSATNPYFPSVEDDKEIAPASTSPESYGASILRPSSPPPTKQLNVPANIPVVNMPPAPALIEPVQEVSQDDIDAAIKHTKWAVSALNFEDIETGIAELKKALASLGA
ncbi:Vta1 like-domain-containing protein [Protomyces lactucae-debilis]|uniref:Vta1 like-domain-containing protein n=1 Tax=Protomyces lactucae-debilis TaxID=2754530 RepID=A0A1Y2FE49_PROLT|nr:Vta1 like-domain-containing protein [Protomyces lactucae-debilis]ORY81897.1 Vta1 like-domain-containing protein [Protomyces lactucae-debilis]